MRVFPHSFSELVNPVPTSLLISALLGLGPGLTHAQHENELAELEEVVVSAQKREQNMQEIPIALSVVSSLEIEHRGINNFAELFELMPNTTISQNVSSIPSLSIRGVSSNVNNIGIESGIGVSVDEVFLGRPSAFSTNLIDIERVEVLRGPQGTLFGKNTIGGLVNILTRKPQFDYESEADFTYGNENLLQFRGYVTGPLIEDKVAGKVSVTWKKRDGWVENRNPDASDLMSVDFWGVRGQLLGSTRDSFNWLLSAEFSQDDTVENYQDVLGGPLAPVDGDPYDRSIETSKNDLFERDIYGFSLKLDWSLDSFNLVSITAARGVDWSGRNDQDYTSVPFFESARSEDQDQWSQEFRIVGGDEKFNWIGGLYYFHQTQDGVDTLFLYEATPPFFGLPYFPGYQENAKTISSIDTTSMAAYLSGTYYFSDRWNITGGARYTSEDKDFEYRQDITVFEVAPGVPLGLIAFLAPPVAPLTDSRSDNDWSGDVSLGYMFTENVNAYAKVSRGFKAGGFQSTSSPSPDPGNLSFAPETMVSYELGLKTDLAQRRVRLNVAAFYSDYEDKQEQFFNGVFQVTSNAAAATIKGFEVDVTALPLDWLTLGVTLGYQDAKYDDYFDPVTGTDFSNNELPGIPPWNASFSAQVNRSLSSGWTWLLRGDVSYRDEVYGQPSNNPFFIGEAHTLVNARLGFTSPEGRYTISVWSKNLFDSDFEVNRSEISGLGTYVRMSEPRSWGIELRGRWGD